MSDIGEDGASAALRTSAASRGAPTVARPAGDLAVNRTLEVIASGVVDVKAARDTTVLNRGDNRLGALLGTASTGLGAGTPGRPARKLAINRASLSVAHTLVSGRAFVTTVLGSNIDIVVARLFASTTGLAACGPRVPRVYAIDGARVSVAVLLSRDRQADSTTVGSSDDDGASTAVDTTTAVVSANTPGTEA